MASIKYHRGRTVKWKYSDGEWPTTFWRFCSIVQFPPQYSNVIYLASLAWKSNVKPEWNLVSNSIIKISLLLQQRTRKWLTSNTNKLFFLVYSCSGTMFEEIINSYATQVVATSNVYLLLHKIIARKPFSTLLAGHVLKCNACKPNSLKIPNFGVSTWRLCYERFVTSEPKCWIKKSFKRFVARTLNRHGNVQINA